MIPDMTSLPIPNGVFTATQAQWRTGLTARQLRYWRQTGWVVPSVRPPSGRCGVQVLYSRDDLVRLRAIATLLHEGFSTMYLRRKYHLRHLRERVA